MIVLHCLLEKTPHLTLSFKGIPLALNEYCLKAESRSELLSISPKRTIEIAVRKHVVWLFHLPRPVVTLWLEKLWPTSRGVANHGNVDQARCGGTSMVRSQADIITDLPYILAPKLA